jgi:hypothetical protein
MIASSVYPCGASGRVRLSPVGAPRRSRAHARENDTGQGSRTDGRPAVGTRRAPRAQETRSRSRLARRRAGHNVGAAPVHTTFTSV